uniref:Integrase zinc-binding domain-containing protein n=1 Tax=Panagrolaimus davidi TaxID=227884 RepID=A0A914QNZ0_9BILA
MADRIFAYLDRSIEELDAFKNEYTNLFQQHTVPWSNVVKIMFRAQLKLLQENMEYWDESITKLENKAKNMRNDDEEKQQLLDKIDDHNNDARHRLLKREVSKILLEGQGYLELEQPTPNTTANIPTPTLSTPNVNIQKFDGDYLKWRSFKERFDHSVHHKSYPNVEKMIALLGLLEDDALAEVQGFEVSNANYNSVYQALEERFGNNQILVRKLQTNLRSVQPATQEAKSIRETVNAVTNMVRQLENLNVNINNESMILDVIEKMPKEERIELRYFSMSTKDVTIEQVLQKMKEMAFKAEIAADDEKEHCSRRIGETKKHNFKQFVPNPNPTQNFNRKSFCALCGENHLPSNCPKYPSVDDKIKQLKLINGCTRCARRNHSTLQCQANAKCNKCNGNHYTFMCNSKNLKQQGNGNKSNVFVSVEKVEKQQGCLLTKEITVMNPDTNETSTAIIFFDSGSQRSFISDKLIGQLKLPREGKAPLNLHRIGAKATTIMSSLVKLRIKTVESYQDIYVNSIKRIANNVPVITVTEKVASNCIDMVNKTPDILIGMDYFFEFITSFSNKDDIFIIDSKIGKMLSKRIKMPQTSTISALAVEPQMFENEENDIQNFWKLESMGIKDNPIDECEAPILEKFRQSINFKDNRFYVSWPEKLHHKPLPTNFGLALGRLNSNLKRLQQDQKLMKEYHNIVLTQFNNGQVEVAPEKPQGGLIHYLPHHAVVNYLKATTKIRMVFDASAKISKNAPSLNECFIRGPLEMPDICGILFRTRICNYLLTGDIEKAFHQVFLNEDSRDAVRFLWVKDPSKPATGENLIILRFVVVPFGVISSPFILWIITVIILQKLGDDELQQMIKDNTYVDNMFFMCNDENNAIQLFDKIRKHFLTASMNIREWLSNSSTINEAFPPELKQKSTVTKILGIQWNSQEDTFMFELKNDCQEERWTKRKVLKFIASTYDPLGFLSPVSIKGKLFMQKLFQQQLSWDTPLTDDLQKEWQAIVQKWKGTVTIPRKIVHGTMPTNNLIEIHAFADASKIAYCACVYLRIKTSMGYECHLIFAKTRLHPLCKKLTIPKMEVMGIWLASKIASFVAKELKIETSRKFIWTDSQISYYWFQKLPKDVFVSNRLKDVLASNSELLFVPGTLNPADLGTRGVSIEELKDNKHWWHGPQFLQQPSETWPKTKDLTQTITAVVNISTCADNTIVLQNIELNREYEIETNLSWTNFKIKIAMKAKNVPKEENLTAKDLVEAETVLLKQEQQIYFSIKLEKELKLAKDETGIYRIHTRFDHAEMINPNPIFLPKASPITKMIVMDIHERLHHAGIPHTLSTIREKFWIPSGRAAVKKILLKCKSCKIWRGKSFALPNMPSLPSSRINKTQPFENTGIDYCGPFKIKGEKEKSWIILFTCFKDARGPKF